jgi:hypothetical protein
MPKKQLKLTDCKGWEIKEKQKKKKEFVSLLDLPSFIHLNIDQVEKLKKHIYDNNDE